MTPALAHTRGAACAGTVGPSPNEIEPATGDNQVCIAHLHFAGKGDNAGIAIPIAAGSYDDSRNGSGGDASDTGSQCRWVVAGRPSMERIMPSTATTAAARHAGQLHIHRVEALFAFLDIEGHIALSFVIVIPLLGKPERE